MSKTKLLVVQGMGQATAETLKKDVVDTLQGALELYEPYKQEKIEDFIEVVPVIYNDIFDDYRQKMADRSKKVSDRLRSIPGTSNIAQEIVESITSIEDDINDDEFFKTHLLDVIFYRLTVLGEQVRIKIGKEIAKAVTDGAAKVHLLGYSLGSSALHDTLSKLYGPEQFRADGTDLNLSISDHRLGSISMVANVSRLLESSWAPVRNSIIRPGSLGCTAQFLEFRHKLDPFAQLKPFNPTNNGDWISQQNWNNRAYLLREPSEVTSANTHALSHYLQNPTVHFDLFTQLFNFEPGAPATAKAIENYQATTAEGKASALEDAIEALDLSDSNSVKRFMKAAKAVKEFVTAFGDNF